MQKGKIQRLHGLLTMISAKKSHPKVNYIDGVINTTRLTDYCILTAQMHSEYFCGSNEQRFAIHFMFEMEEPTAEWFITVKIGVWQFSVGMCLNSLLASGPLRSIK